ncbi:alternate-type signal peptide domain-containing protein [Curtobacterium sp. MCLR17_032]|uniref:alternate-type signal peptide domain-containing protein n=1 Tax=Curtobacterium sp. MCLR17_032 TaxID=2175650 RepID=UPI000DA8CDF4|nr:alternate-type signal peptide domain-containing protein [Curtobacterium sp. MCLR17_032]WIE60604.1 alternate-type signal peptide domain-containing protein [Curtobacterium sp. MCLR17_032]
MHKIVTGTIASAAGVALLLGGAGSFALWNASASSAAAAVSSGTLTLTANRDGAWTDLTNGRSNPIDPASVLMVPGNTYRFTQTLVVGATGDDLSATLTYAPQSITGDADLLAATQKTLDVSSSTAALTKTADPTVFTVTPSAATSTVLVTFTITLPQSATTGQGGTVDVGALAFTLTQTPIGSTGS